MSRALAALALLLLPLTLAADEIDNFNAYSTASNGMWVNGRWDTFSAPIDTPAKTLILQGISVVHLKNGPLHKVAILRIKEPDISDPATTSLAPNPILGLIDSDQGRKIVILLYSGNEKFSVRIVDAHPDWVEPTQGGTPLYPILPSR